MAGSYGHVTTDHTLRSPQKVCSMLECVSGDVYEAVEELYGMIWYLTIGADDPTALVEEARENYREGLEASPTKRFKTQEHRSRTDELRKDRAS